MKPPQGTKLDDQEDSQVEEIDITEICARLDRLEEGLKRDTEALARLSRDLGELSQILADYVDATTADDDDSGA